MKQLLILPGILCLALTACGPAETTQDGISAEDAEALDKAAEKLDREAEPAEAIQ